MPVARYYCLSTPLPDDQGRDTGLPDLSIAVEAAVIVGRPPAAFLNAAGLPVADGAPVPVVYDCLIDASIDRTLASSTLLTPAEWDSNPLAQALAPYCLETTVQRAGAQVRVKQADVLQTDTVVSQPGPGYPNVWLGRPDL